MLTSERRSVDCMREEYTLDKRAIMSRFSNHSLCIKGC